MEFWLCAAYLALLGVLSHAVGERLPRQSFDPESRFFAAFSWEKNGQIYEKLGIRRWKDRVPDMSRLDCRMHPKQLRSVRSGGELQRLMQEMCVAEAVHWGLILLSPALLFLWPGWGGLTLMLADIFLGNLPFILIQRYNRPRLAALCRLRSCRERMKKDEDPDPQL